MRRTAVLAAGGLLLVAVAAPTSAGDSVGAFDPGTGEWHLLRSDGSVNTFFFGNPGDYPFMGDWDCDGIDTPGLYRQADGFVYLTDTNRDSTASRTFFFGNPGDVPLAGDFDGDGCDTVSIYRPDEQRFYIIDELGRDGRGLGTATTAFRFGDPGDTPFVGDFDGDGRDTVGLHRPSTGLVYYRNDLTGGIASNTFVFGDPGDQFVTGDWDGDGMDTVGVYR